MGAFEYFVSYNSRDVTPARATAERLMSEGVSVWFNEYGVPADRQAEFQVLVNQGIDDSTRALLVVGSGYAASPYCNVEVERILRKLPLEHIHLKVVDGGGLARLRSMYSELDGAAMWPAESPVAITMGRSEWNFAGTGLRFDDSAWFADPAAQFQDQAWTEAFALAGLEGRSEHRVWSATEGPPTRLVVHVAQLAGDEADRIRSRYAATSEDVETVDRARLKEELRYFDEEAERVSAAITHHGTDRAGQTAPEGAWARWRGKPEKLGVHLFSSSIGGHEIKQRLFSFRSAGLRAIFRVYKVSFLHPLLHDAPFVVRFVFRFPDDFQAFCAGIPWCDALVSSLRLVDTTIPSTSEFMNRTSDFVRGMRGKR